jgi:hypothetical protein
MPQPQVLALVRRKKRTDHREMTVSALPWRGAQLHHLRGQDHGDRRAGRPRAAGPARLTQGRNPRRDSRGLSLAGPGPRAWEDGRRDMESPIRGAVGRAADRPRTPDTAGVPRLAPRHAALQVRRPDRRAACRADRPAVGPVPARAYTAHDQGGAHLVPAAVRGRAGRGPVWRRQGRRFRARRPGPGGGRLRPADRGIQAGRRGGGPRVPGRHVRAQRRARVAAPDLPAHDRGVRPPPGSRRPAARAHRRRHRGVTRPRRRTARWTAGRRAGR